MMCAILTSCENIYKSYNVKIINNSAEDISVFYTKVYDSDPFGLSITISKGESYEYSLDVNKEHFDGACVAFLFSDREIDIENDVPNQELTDSETSKFLFLKYSLWELIQMDCTITFNGFENE